MPSISVKGDRRFIDAVGIVAKQHNTTVAALVRSLLDKEFGSEIEKAEYFLSSHHPCGRSGEAAAYCGSI